MTFFPSSGLVDMGLRKWCWSFLSEWLRHRSKNIYSHCLSVSLFVQYWETFIHPAVGISTVFKHCVWVLYVLGTLGEHSVNSASSVPTKQPFSKSCMARLQRKAIIASFATLWWKYLSNSDFNLCFRHSWQYSEAACSPAHHREFYSWELLSEGKIYWATHINYGDCQKESEWEKWTPRELLFILFYWFILNRLNIQHLFNVTGTILAKTYLPFKCPSLPNEHNITTA